MAIELRPRGTEETPCIPGTRIRVLDIGIEFEYFGKSADEIIQAHPHLTLAQVYAALSYFYEHIIEMQEKIRKDKEYVEKLKQAYPAKAMMIAQ